MLNLEKPIIFFDLETTGVLPASDRIVEISLIKLNPGSGEEERLSQRLNPGIPIPAASSAIHHIYDHDVADCPTFLDIAPEIYLFIGDADLAGYNVIKFDIPILIEEFSRAGIEFKLDQRRIVDVQNIFHKMEQRTLVAAYKFYCQKELVNAHSSMADTEATYEVLLAMLDRYKNSEIVDAKGQLFKPVVNDVAQLHKFTTNPNHADLAGHIALDSEGRERINFGKHKGRLVREVFVTEPSYYDWIMKSEFPIDTKRLLERIKREIDQARKAR
jgi:DNA polymerase III subunit epsilon